VILAAPRYTDFMGRAKLVSLLFLISLALEASPIPDVHGTDQAGRPFSVHSLKGSYILISFVFSSCPMPKMCPLTMRLNQKVQLLWKKDIPHPLKLLIVTLDPEGDTPEVLKKYGERFQLDPKNSFLITGNAQALSDFGSAFNVAGWPSGNTTVHNLKTILVGPKLEEIKQYKENEWSPELIIKDAKDFIRRSQ